MVWSVCPMNAFCSHRSFCSDKHGLACVVVWNRVRGTTYPPGWHFSVFLRCFVAYCGVCDVFWVYSWWFFMFLFLFCFVFCGIVWYFYDVLEYFYDLLVLFLVIFRASSAETSRPYHHFWIFLLFRSGTSFWCFVLIFRSGILFWYFVPVFLSSILLWLL